MGSWPCLGQTRVKLCDLSGYSETDNTQEAYLPTASIRGQIVSEILAQLCSENCIQTLLNLFWVALSLNPNFWQAGLLDVVLSEYPDKIL